MSRRPGITENSRRNSVIEEGVGIILRRCRCRSPGCVPGRRILLEAAVPFKRAPHPVGEALTLGAEKGSPQSLGGLWGEKGSRRDLLSHRVTPAVPSAHWCLTSEFGMGSGGTTVLSSPANWHCGALRRSRTQGWASLATGAPQLRDAYTDRVDDRPFERVWRRSRTDN